MLVSRLRRALRTGSPTATVRRDPGGYAFDGVTTDVAMFHDLAAQAVTADECGDPRLAADLAGRALALWPGPGGFTPFVDHPESVWLSEERLAVLTVWARSALQVGRRQQVLPELLAACRMHPYAEELWRLAIVALYHADRQVEALALYQEIRRRLVDDLGVEPGAALRDAERQVLTQQLEGAASAVGDGERRVPPWADLPIYHDRYVSDGVAAAALSSALAMTRHVTVIGPAGVGKTRLVVETLPTVAARWPGAVAFCSLSSVVDADGLVGAVAGTLGVRIPARADPVAAVVEGLGERQVVLVLDTCERLAPAVGALSDELRRGCCGLTIVATSRMAPPVEDGASVEVAGLDPSTTGSALFIDRAGRAVPGHTVTDDERATIEMVCARLDGLPLAIELAAARSRTFNPHELAERLDRRFSILRTTSGAPHDRHASLRGSFEWSYRALEPVEQHVFRILGVFRGPADLRARSRTSHSSTVTLRRVSPSLVEHSLVVARHDAGRTRFTQLDSLRGYARELLGEAGEDGVARRRHAQHVAARKDEYVEMCRGPGEADAVTGLDDLWPDLRAAVHWAVDTGRHGRHVRPDPWAGSPRDDAARSPRCGGGWTRRPRSPATTTSRSADVLAVAAIGDWIVGDPPTGIARSTRAMRLAVTARPRDDRCVGGRDAQRRTRGSVRLRDPLPPPCPNRRLAAGDELAAAWTLVGVAMAHAYQGRPCRGPRRAPPGAPDRRAGRRAVPAGAVRDGQDDGSRR